MKEYKLPLGASFAFVIIVIGLLFSRTINRIVLTDVLGKNSNNDYSKLLSSDKSDDFKKNETVNENNITENSSAAPTPSSSFTVAPNPTPAPPPVQTDPEATPPPTPPFTASILGFGLYNTQYEYCSSGGGSISTNYKCYKRYFYKARIKTVNGPGTVKYSWEGNFDVINSSGSFSVTSIEAYTDISKEFKLACGAQPQLMQIKLKVIEPNVTETPVQEQMHDCSIP